MVEKYLRRCDISLHICSEMCFQREGRDQGPALSSLVAMMTNLVLFILGNKLEKKNFFSRIALTSRNLYYLTDNKWSCELLFHIVMWCIVEANFCWKFLNEEQRSFTLWGVSSVGSQFFSFILDLDWLSFLRMFTSLFHYSITDNNKYLDPEKYRLNTESSPTVGKKWRTLWNERWSVSLLDFSTDMQALKITRK